MNSTTLQWFCESFNEAKEDPSLDRIEFYEKYFKNLCPKEFKVSAEDNKIIINIPPRQAEQ